MFHRIVEWWSQPSAKERIFSAMSRTEWRRGNDIYTAAKACRASFYVKMNAWEDAGLIESKVEDGPILFGSHGFGGRVARRVYRLRP